MPTGLEIVDTAIKVGLGAIISGTTTYVITRRTQDYETYRSLQKEKTALLKEAMVSLEQAGSLVNDSQMSIFRLAVAEGVDRQQKFWEPYRALTTAFNQSKNARSLCYMIGQKQMAEQISLYCDSIAEVINHFATQRLDYDLQFIDAQTRKRDSLKASVLDQLAGAL